MVLHQQAPRYHSRQGLGVAPPRAGIGDLSVSPAAPTSSSSKNILHMLLLAFLPFSGFSLWQPLKPTLLRLRRLIPLMHLRLPTKGFDPGRRMCPSLLRSALIW